MLLYYKVGVITKRTARKNAVDQLSHRFLVSRWVITGRAPVISLNAGRWGLDTKIASEKSHLSLFSWRQNPATSEQPSNEAMPVLSETCVW